MIASLLVSKGVQSPGRTDQGLQLGGMRYNHGNIDHVKYISNVQCI